MRDFDHRAARRSGGIALQFQKLRLVIENFDQLGNALAGDGAGADHFGVAALFDGIQPLRGELAENHVRIGVSDDRSYSSPR